MKNIYLLLLLLSFTAAALAQKPKVKAPTYEDTIQYSLGVYMMQQILAKTGLTVDKDASMFKKAIDDVAAGKQLLVDASTVEARLVEYQKYVRQEKGRKLEQLLFAKVKADPKFVALPSGVMYTVVAQGQGPVPGLKDTVIININGRLADGTVLDDVSKSKRSYMALASDMIPGLRDVILKMQQGAVVTAVIPASQAYGEVGTASIPPNSALVYDIGLVSVKKAK